MSQEFVDKLPIRCVLPVDYAKTGSAAMAYVDAKQIVRAVSILYDAEYFLEDLTGIDVEEGFEVLYHFDHFEKPGRITLRVRVPHDEATIPSIAAIYQGAEWHERETTDFYGISFEGNPNPVPLLLPEEGDIHPLLRVEKKRARVSITTLVGDTLATDCPDMAPAPEPEEKEAEGGASPEDETE